jgi:hypothetical protein
MDHRYIEEQNITDLYLLGKLPAEERVRFEEHFIDCDECLDRLEMTEKFRRGLRSVATEEATRARVYAQAGLLGWLARLSRWRQAGLLVSAVLLLIVLPTVFFVREIRRVRHELEQAKIAIAQGDWHTAAALKKQLQEAEQELAEQRRQLEVQLQRERQERASLADELSRLTRPQVNAPLFALNTVRSADPTQPVSEIVVSRSPEWMVISVELEAEPEYETYRAAILTADDRVIWSQSGLQPNFYGTLLVSFNSSFFRDGNYRLTLEGLAQHGRFVRVANYPFRVIKK